MSNIKSNEPLGTLSPLVAGVTYGALWPLVFLGTDEQAEMLSRMPAEAEANGLAVLPLMRDEFIAAVSHMAIPDYLYCLHIEYVSYHVPGFGQYQGPLMVLVDERVMPSPLFMAKLHSLGASGKLTTRESVMAEIPRTAN